ncbi:hypothetical protein ACF1CG_27000 [Streptomyces sp. NPDC014773]|uniref:hypothetical protein n=1 Tax=Streptomyces sp. NPDC014773 TaxID=3364908 RepID=UPI0036F6610A
MDEAGRGVCGRLREGVLEHRVLALGPVLLRKSPPRGARRGRTGAAASAAVPVLPLIGVLPVGPTVAGAPAPRRALRA